jgi:HlyD family type I secretion membrane fusion protein
MTSAATSASGAGLLPGGPAPSSRRRGRPRQSEPTNIAPLLRGPTRLGLAVAFAFFVLFGGWAALAPLSSGAIAPGIVSPDSNRKVIQHLEGGIIRTVHVREGQRVAAGDTLITLEAARAEASFTARDEQRLRLLIQAARLAAEAQDRDTMVLPDEVVGLDNSELADFVETQRGLLAARQTTIRQQEAIYERQIEQLGSEIASVEAETAGMKEQIRLIEKELESKEELLKQKLIAQSPVLELQREKARLESAIAANAARVARALQSIEETRLAGLQARESYRDHVARETTEVNNRLAQLNEDMVASSDILRRTEITSPVDGIVLNFNNQTPGGVIRPGEPIMDVVPIDDDLIVVARLQPRDIDVVRVGLPAQVSLLPFASRNSLPLSGEVIQVGADSVLDRATGQYYFEIRVRVGLDELARHEGFYLSPGMPADVTIVTGERTMLQYLLDPLARSLRSALVYD